MAFCALQDVISRSHRVPSPEFCEVGAHRSGFGGHVSIVASPEVARRVAQQCGVMHVWDHSHVTFIRGIFKKDEATTGGYYVFVTK